MAVRGYPHLASHISISPSSLITRGFSSLAARNILYLQAELVHLEMQLHELEERDSKSALGKKAMYAKDWYWLQSSATESDREQWETMSKIRKTLKEYYDTILQQAAVSALPRPVNQELRVLQEWLERPGLDNMTLIGEDRKVWGFTDRSMEPAADLLAINKSGPEDAFSSWVVHVFVVWVYQQLWHRVRRQRPEDEETGVIVYKEEVVMRWTRWISAAVASTLPIVSTVVLYYVKDPGTKLGVAVLFTFLFALALMAFTRTRSMDIFIATTAFAAVEVVFISNNGTTN